MAPTPPSTPPPKSLPIRRHEADTITKNRFFHVVDHRSETITIKDVCEDENVSHGTGKRWLHQRKHVGVAALRRTGKRRSGRPKKMSAEIMSRMLDPRQNPVRRQPWPAQAEHFHIDATPRTVRQAFHDRTPRAGRYKMARVRSISNKNKELRVQYAREHENHTVGNFFQYVHWSDEAHFDPDQTYGDFVLREEGTRYEPENMQSMSDMKGVRLHVAASVSWHHKGALQFYNDEHDSLDIKVSKKDKPRKKKSETIEMHRQRVLDWEALDPHNVEIKPKGNSMTQQYYVDRLLPIYVDEIHACRLQPDPSFCLFQEDNDPSHGTKSKDNVVKRCKAASWLATLNHPPQSSDLNSMEGVWNILKMRVAKRVCNNVDELKRVILDEWDRITLEEIQARIREMPDRCKRVIESGGAPVRSHLW